MSWVVRYINSSIGLKTLMALSGLALVGFLVGHLSGNLLVFIGPEAINAYAKGLRDYLAVLWILRLGLIGSAVLHIYCGIKLTQLNRAAKPIKYTAPSGYNSTVQASRASKSMILTGLVILSFLLYHLAHLTFRWTHPEFAQLGHYEVYSMLMMSFQSPILVAFYCISVILLMMHLNHGIRSLFQTLGINHNRYNKLLDLFGPGLSTLLALGFLSIPLAIMFGIVH